MNEKFSPELLEHKTHIVDCILEQIRDMVCRYNSIIIIHVYMLVVYFDVHFSRKMGGMMVSKALHTIHYRNNILCMQRFLR